MIIYPAMDLIGGKCVRLSQGDFSTAKTYDAFPLDMAMRFQDVGLTHLHMVDLDGAREGRVINYKVLEKVAGKTSLKIDFGGGMRSEDDLRIAFECGAAQIVAGSIAVKKPEVFSAWLKDYGNDKVVLGCDLKDGKVAIHGWEEKAELTAIQLIERVIKEDPPAKHVICTDVSKDGLLQGPSIPLYKELRERFLDLYIIASGGVSSLQDLEQLKAIRVDGAIVGKAIYEGRVSIEELGRNRW